MDNIELVIKIPKDSYEATCRGSMLPSDVENVVNAIKKGLPLPKGHGDLIDCKALLEESDDIWYDCKGGYVSVVYLSDIEEARAIIEADKAESEE